ncbi:unnamed protein product [Caenorhabditis angaria]|uniref:TNFR-Cys domain-containing protein n=1 Tax=Caenorhabditis angaria TaxID=860376 RepID=A0A9P1J330_9PELO|nr:unnamed protein product [Caenorhabditis angaria]
MGKIILFLCLAFVGVGAKIIFREKPQFEISGKIEKCPEGEYYDAFIEECFACSQCSNFMYEIKSCTPTNNAVCGWCGNHPDVEKMSEKVLVSYQNKCLMSSLSFVDFMKMEPEEMEQLRLNSKYAELLDDDEDDEEEEEDWNEDENSFEDSVEELDRRHMFVPISESDERQNADLEVYDSYEYDPKSPENDEEDSQAADDNDEDMKIVRSEIKKYFDLKKSMQEDDTEEILPLKIAFDDNSDSEENDDDSKFDQIWIDDRVLKFELGSDKIDKEEWKRQAELKEKLIIDSINAQRQKAIHLRVLFLCACFLIIALFVRHTCRRHPTFRTVHLHHIDEKILKESGANAEKANKYAYDGPAEAV